MFEWQDAGMPIAVRGMGGPGSPSRFDSAACITWLVQREVNKVAGGETAKDRLARLQGDAVELKLAVDRGELVPVALVEPAMTAAIISARERIRGEPARIAAALEGLDRAEREALLRDMFDDALRRLANWRQALDDETEGDERAD